METAATLLEYGALTNAESKAGFTPLHLAAQQVYLKNQVKIIYFKQQPVGIVGYAVIKSKSHYRSGVKFNTTQVIKETN